MRALRSIHPPVLMALGVGFLVALPARAQTVPAPYPLIEFGATWQYRDQGVAPGPEWRELSYDAGGWQTGAAEFGYGEGDEETRIGYGPDPRVKPITTYYRHLFHIPDRSAVKRTTLRMLVDDGAVVHVNGVEVYRSNMPVGPVGPETLAVLDLEPEPTPVAWGEGEIVQFGLWAGYLTTGTNLIAVEVHQVSATTEDCSFDLELIANRPLGPPTVRLVSPASGTVVGDPAVQLRVEASDHDGHVYRVDYFSGTNKIGQVMGFPFALNWQGTPGRHRLQALAFDYSGRSAFSEVVLLQVGGVAGDRLLRGPYLQVGTPTSIVVCWRTDWLTDGVVRFGTDVELLDKFARGTEVTTEHAVLLEGLEPDTRYYYAVGTAQGELAGGVSCSFVTAPVVPRATRIWVIGDSGTANFNARFVRDIYEDYSSDRATDLWLMLGDNAYESGTDPEYQAAVFDMYTAMLRRSVVWPTIGNHDSAMADGEGRIAYLDIFRLPREGEAGGLASGTENYYSFDYSNIHFICLDSSLSDREPGGTMLTWLEHDLAATDKEWIIAFWHHPPYSFGTHNSDVEFDLIDMRENALPILESHGVDLVLSGHSHVYERSYLLNGHYGYSTDLAAGMVLDPGFGRADVEGPYRKPAGGLGAGRGTVYTVCGCSGEGGHFAVRRHPAMVSSMSGFGCLVIDVEGDRLDLKFLNSFDAVADYFTITKGLPGPGVYPRLRVERGGAGEPPWLTWPTSMVPYRLESAGGPGEEWVPWPLAATTVGRTHRASVGPVEGQRLFRLKGDE